MHITTEKPLLSQFFHITYSFTYPFKNLELLSEKLEPSINYFFKLLCNSPRLEFYTPDIELRALHGYLGL